MIARRLAGFIIGTSLALQIMTWLCLVSVARDLNAIRNGDNALSVVQVEAKPAPRAHGLCLGCGR